MFFAVPIMEGMIPYQALHDGSATIDDFFVLNEILAVKYENKLRAMNAAERKSG